MISLGGISLRDFEYALAIARTGNFGRAAEECGVSQPALSEQVKKLETLLGCSLFERSRRGATLTSDGQLLMPQIERAVREARGVVELARGRGGELRGALSLGVIPTLGPYYIPGLIALLRDIAPTISLLMHEAQTATLLSDLLNHTLDLALVALPVTSDAVAFQPLFFEPFRVLVPQNHDLQQKSKLNASDLARADLLLLEGGHCLREQTISLCRVPAGGVLPVSPRFASSLEMLRHMVAAGEGVAVMPALALADRDVPSALSGVRRFADDGVGREIGLVWRKTDPRGAEFAALSARLRENLPSGVRKIESSRLGS